MTRAQRAKKAYAAAKKAVGVETKIRNAADKRLAKATIRMHLASVAVIEATAI